ncbi:hypothetical protein OHB12_16625 [Nocardia sp. NBC_01730]|nr:hypothetical protein OHB12_16625 [Nocardia sp. NBC_01730]
MRRIPTDSGLPAETVGKLARRVRPGAACSILNNAVRVIEG